MKRNCAFVIAALLLAGIRPAAAQSGPSRDDVLRGMRKAAEFFRTRVSNHGGYHFAYTEDLSYGRSEQGEGPDQPEIQREGTPIVAMAYLDAFEATHDRFYLEAARDAANLLVSGQLCSGGWDYFIEFNPERRKNIPYRLDGKCGSYTGESRRHPTTLDDNVTQAAVRLMMRVDRDLEFQDPKIHEAALFALDSLTKAQYPNGAWPQRFTRSPDPKEFPVKRASYPESWPRTWPGSDYQGHYTFNDNTIVDAIDMMLEAARIYKNPRFQAAAERGGDFLLLAQMPDPQPGWAQQYDRDMHPAWARRFEPPSVTGGESQGVMKMLLVLYRETGNRKYLEPLSRAIAYYQKSALPPVENPSEIRRRACPGNTLCLARFAELQTNRPLYITKGTRINVMNQSATIADGYEVSYSDQSVITHYGVLVNGNRLNNIAKEYEELAKVGSSAPRRDDRLHGLSPWADDWTPTGAGRGSNYAALHRASAAELAPRVAKILAGMDARGAWVQEGVIGKAERLVLLFAARDMVATIGGKAIPMKENDTLEVFPGGQPPRQRIIRSGTFAENLGVLSAYVAALSK